MIDKTKTLITKNVSSLQKIFENPNLRFEIVDELPALIKKFKTIEPSLPKQQANRIRNSFTYIQETVDEQAKADHEYDNKNSEYISMHPKLLHQKDLLVFERINVNLTISKDFIENAYPLLYNCFTKMKPDFIKKLITINNNIPVTRINVDIDLNNIKDLLAHKTTLLRLYNPCVLPLTIQLSETPEIEIKRKQLNKIYELGLNKNFFNYHYYSHKGYRIGIDCSYAYRLSYNQTNETVPVLVPAGYQHFAARFDVAMDHLTVYYRNIANMLVIYMKKTYVFDYVKLPSGENTAVLTTNKPLGKAKIYQKIDNAIKDISYGDNHAPSIADIIIIHKLFKRITFRLFTNASHFFNKKTISATVDTLVYDHYNYYPDSGISDFSTTIGRWNNFSQTKHYQEMFDIEKATIVGHEQWTIESEIADKSYIQTELTDPKKKTLINFIANTNYNKPMPKSYRNPTSEKKTYITADHVIVPNYINTQDMYDDNNQLRIPNFVDIIGKSKSED